MNKSKMKPIAMRCNEEQFNDIKQILIDNLFTVSSITPFEVDCLLVNNRFGILGLVTNYEIGQGSDDEYGREYFDKWDKDTFLKYCGIETKPKLKPIAMRCNQKQFNEIKQVLIDNNCTLSQIYEFEENTFLVNNRYNEYRHITNSDSNENKSCHNREYFDKWDKDTFLEYCGIEVKTKTENKMKTVITAQELLEIHKIACENWKAKIRTDYFLLIRNDQTIHFRQDEINEMFKAATAEQKPVLEKIFGKQVKPIEWDRIKTGSQVMLEYAGEHCNGLNDIDISKPVDVIFYKTPHYIYDRGKFCIQGHYTIYCTFHQDGKYILFSADKNTDYITEVVQY
jgi:hypothetical protein